LKRAATEQARLAARFTKAEAEALDKARRDREQTRLPLEATQLDRQEAVKRLKDSRRTSAPQDTVPESQGKRAALVIGNAAYRNSPLANAVNDAVDAARILKSRGFQVTEVLNGKLTDIRSAVRDFSDQVVDSNVALIYYSGHGVEVNGRNYLIPIDADSQRDFEVADQGYDASQFVEMMNALPSRTGQRVNILILDACRDNPLSRSWRSAGRGLAKMDAPTGTFIAFSTSPGQVASDGQGRNSPFTKHLIAAIQQPDQPIELVFKSVRRAVLAETKGVQVPWENSSLVGDFYFTTSP